MGWSEFFEMVERQGGVVARRQAAACDISEDEFDRRMKREAWPRPFRGVARAPGARDDARTQHRAALLAVGGDAALAGESALWWRGVIDKPPPFITILVRWGRRGRDLRGVRVIRSRVIIAEDLEEVDGALVTTIERACLDLAGRVPERRLRGLLIDARQRRKVELAKVAERALMVLRVPGRNRLLRLVAELDPTRADSILTHAVHQRLVEEGLSPDEMPATVEIPGLVLHPDITFTAHRLAIECNGFGFHSERADLTIDNRKTNAYQVARWKVLHIDWDRFENDWDGFVAELRALIA
jgi:hypothetical protein